MRAVNAAPGVDWWVLAGAYSRPRKSRTKTTQRFMSLISFLKASDVRERFRAEFIMPPLGAGKELLAPPLSENYPLIGTAFDYLLRFYIERLNPKSVTGEWVADQAALCDIESAGCSVSLPAILKKAQRAYKKYLRSGTMDDNLLRETICLAQLDVIYRRRLLHGADTSYFKTIGKIDPADIRDLQRLIALVQPEAFKAKTLSVLNPTFGRASKLVGGADCDLIIDDALIDIKTSKNFRAERNHFDQLMGYYVPSMIGGIAGAPKGHQIRRLGIYLSRYGHLWLFKVDDVIKDDQLPNFVSWFRARAKGT